MSLTFVNSDRRCAGFGGLMVRLPRPIVMFSAATLAPVPLLAAGAFWGGAWIAAALVALTVLIFLLDELVVLASDDAAPGIEFPAGEALSMLLGLLHLPILVLGVAAVAGATGLHGGERLAALGAFGIYMGQVMFSNAHELIHHPSRRALWLGTLVYATCLYGHHVTAHRLIHHRFVASAQDPNTARLGEGFWRFAWRAWVQAFWAGAAIERERRQVAGHPVWRSPYIAHLAMSLATAIGMALAFGAAGLLAFVALAMHAAVQMLLADYVQHYGLTRHTHADGRLAPVAAEHSWNAPHPISAAFMLNAPRHSDHHVNPMKPFAALELPEPGEAPMLPASLPAMSCLALVPPLWRRVMDARALAWREAGGGMLMAAE